MTARDAVRLPSFSLLALAVMAAACQGAPSQDTAENAGPADGRAADDPAADAKPRDPVVEAAPSDEDTGDAAGSEPDDEAQTLAPIAPTSAHPFSALDLLAMDRLSDPQLSADGQTLVFVRRVTDMAANKGRTDLFSIGVGGGEPVRLTSHPDADTNPRLSPDGKTVYFISGRSGTPAIWRLALPAGDAQPVSDLALPVSNLVVSPDGEHLAFSIEVFADCPDLACTKQRLDEFGKRDATGQAYDQLLARHWDTWNNGRRNHLFVMPVAGGDPIDVTAGLDADVPSRPFGGTEEFAFSPDGNTIVFSARDAGRQEAWSTNFDLFSVPSQGGERTNLTEANEAWDTHPTFSPDGKTLVWAAMKRPGYEADRFAIMAREFPSGEPREVAPTWDRSARDIAFTSDGTSLLVTANDIGQVSLFTIGLADGVVTELVDSGSNTSPMASGDTVYYVHSDLTHPADIYAVPLAGGPSRAVTAINEAKVAAARMGEPEQFSFRGARGDTVYGFAVKPVDFDDSKSYPIAFLIHGGPQGSFGNNFHYRWNPQVYAGAGYGVIMIDFHGSTGYGQKFTDAINGDWGGKPLADLKKGLAAATAQYPWLDRSRACALGASYGGFMVNWIAGNWSDGFRCLVNHDGVFDQRMMYYATEELWFPEWEQGGPYYARTRAFEKHNPVSKVDRWKTPMLVIHGELDYRVPLTQGLGAFTALQRRGIPSRLVVYPDENHWVLAPANSLHWHDEVLKWMQEQIAAEPRAAEPSAAG